MKRPGWPQKRLSKQKQLELQDGRCDILLQRFLMLLILILKLTVATDSNFFIVRDIIVDGHLLLRIGGL
jgi:hypothetical protein